jgi:indolepyruvate ferredoxin oxidoreductase alpha subunit
MNTVYNKGNTTTIVLDNRITGMTGHQEHPGTGFTVRQEPANMVDYAEIGKSFGVKSIRKIDPYDMKATMEVLKEEMAKDEPSLILCMDSPCMLLRRAKPLERFKTPVYQINVDNCRGCKMCLEINCPAISWRDGAGQTKDGHKRKGTVYINPDQCVGCEVCVQICKYDAIEPGKK